MNVNDAPVARLLPTGNHDFCCGDALTIVISSVGLASWRVRFANEFGNIDILLMFEGDVAADQTDDRQQGGSHESS